MEAQEEAKDMLNSANISAILEEFNLLNVKEDAGKPK